MKQFRRWLPWLAIVGVAVVALAIGSGRGDDRPATASARANAIAAEVRCPTCRGLSAAESDAKAARAVREEIRRRVDAGDTDGEIKTYLASRYGDDVLLRPPASGAGALVWALPATGLVLAAGGVALTLRRWRSAQALSLPSGAALPVDPPRARARAATSRRGPNRRPAIVTAVVIVFAVGAGAALASAAGDRRPGDPLTGNIESTSPERDRRLDRAQELIGSGRAVDAVKLFDEVLRDNPDQPEALAYRGWLMKLAGLPDEALGYLDRAVAADPSYADAHFFRGMVLWQDRNDPAAGAAEFRLFLANDPPAAMVNLVEDALERALADAAAAGQTVPTSTTAVPVPGDPEGG